MFNFCSLKCDKVFTAHDKNMLPRRAPITVKIILPAIAKLQVYMKTKIRDSGMI